MKIGNHKIEDLLQLREQDLLGMATPFTIECVIELRWSEDGRELQQRVLVSTPDGNVVVWMRVR